MRIVSLACSNTEIVHALGCGHLLVGVDDHSDWPEELVGALPKLGADLDPDLDAVAALEPDLILATLTVPGHETVVEELEARGLPFIAPEPVSLDDVYRDITDIAAALAVAEPAAVARAEALIAEMRSAVGEADPSTGAGEASVPAAPGPPAPRRRPSILVQWWPKPTYAPGRLSWVTDLVDAAGATNPIGTEAVKSRAVPDDEVAALDPDAIVVAWCGVDPAKYRPEVVRQNPVLADTRAVTNDAVVCIPEAWLGRPGPRLVDGLRALREVVVRVS